MTIKRTLKITAILSENKCYFMNTRADSEEIIPDVVHLHKRTNRVNIFSAEGVVNFTAVQACFMR